jgi:hypothetical protein
MKKNRLLLALPLLMLFLFTANSLQAQTNYKHAQVNAKGEYLDLNGIKQGWITKEGIILNAQGKKVALIDAQGNVLDTDGKKMGRVEKNGTYYSADGAVLLTTSTPKGAQCEVSDKSGKVVAQVHNNYKTQGACVVHCLTTKMEMKP